MAEIDLLTQARNYHRWNCFSDNCVDWQAEFDALPENARQAHIDAVTKRIAEDAAALEIAKPALARFIELKRDLLWGLRVYFKEPVAHAEYRALAKIIRSANFDPWPDLSIDWETYPDDLPLVFTGSLVEHATEIIALRKGGMIWRKIGEHLYAKGIRPTESGLGTYDKSTKQQLNIIALGANAKNMFQRAIRDAVLGTSPVTCPTCGHILRRATREAGASE